MPLTGEAKKEYQRKWYAERRAKGIEYLGGICVECGTSDNLNVDHIDPSTKFRHSVWSYSWQKIYEELDKCQLLCEECHKDKTRRNGDVLNGLGTEKFDKVVALLEQGLSHRTIAKIEKVGIATISRIRRGQRKR